MKTFKYKDSQANSGVLVSVYFSMISEQICECFFRMYIADNKFLKEIKVTLNLKMGLLFLSVFAHHIV